MSEYIVKTVACDMCGAEIDVHDDWTLRNCITSKGYFLMPVESHNEAYPAELRDGVEWAKLDLCPECAKRAAAIHMDVRRDGNSWSYEYSWKGSA